MTKRVRPQTYAAGGTSGALSTSYRPDPKSLHERSSCPCHSEERSDEESLEGGSRGGEHRSFAESVLGEVEGLRMTAGAV
jgi:hypothetical protein